MSIETITSHINSYEEPELQSIDSVENEPNEAIETPHERRLRLHHELAALIPELHELQARHYTLSMGILEMASKPAPSPKKGRTKMTERKRMALQRAHRELHHTRRTLMQEQAEIAKTIHEKRAEQGRLIAETALTNTTITRPRHVEEDTNPKWKEQRNDIEHPINIHVHYGGEDPRDAATLTPDDGTYSESRRYLKNAAH